MDSALFWTPVALEANRLDHTDPPGDQRGPTLSARALAMAQLAMHDAFFAITNEENRYDPNGPSPSVGLDPHSALGAAAARMLTRLYPSQAPRIAGEAAQFLAVRPGDDASREFGEAVADHLFAQRQPDLAFADNSHAPSLAPYRSRVDPYNPDQGFYGPRWGNVAPFAIPRLELAPPSVLAADGTETPFYVTELAEVQAKGRAAGSTRSPEETLKGVYWGYDGAARVGTPPRLYMQVAMAVLSQLAAQAGSWVRPRDHVRAFALVATAMADAGIQAWHYKYQYDLWRPVVGIREGAASFGPEAVPGGVGDADPYWRPLGAPRTNSAGAFTPNFPAYPSGHATFGAAAFETLRRFVRDRDPGIDFDDGAVDPIAFDFVSDEFNGVNRDADGGVRPRHNRRFASLWEAIVENSESRIFLGVHWRYDGISKLGAGGVTEHGKPNSPGEVGALGGVSLGMRIAAALLPKKGMNSLRKPV